MLVVTSRLRKLHKKTIEEDVFEEPVSIQIKHTDPESSEDLRELLHLCSKKSKAELIREFFIFQKESKNEQQDESTEASQSDIRKAI